MAKFIAIIEGKHIKKYNLGKVVLPMTVVRKHLYRTDDKFFHQVRTSNESIMFTDLESTQAYGDGTKQSYIDPDDTIAFLDTAPGGGNKSVGFLSWGSVVKNPMVFVYAAVGVVIVVSVLGKFI